MNQFLFGETNRRLYGVFTEAEAGARGAAVLLCYPGVHEYNTSHWAFRRLASGLNQGGHSTLRFDYFGTGDSAGDCAEVTLESMVADIETAGQELLDRGRARRIWLVGARLGATAALLASASEKLPVRGLVLWDAVTDGKRYLEELGRIDRLRDLLFLHWRSSGRKRDELLGYAFPQAARASLESLDLGRQLAAKTWPRQGSLDKIAYVSGPSDPGYPEMEKILRSKEAPLERLLVPDRDEERTITGNDVSLPSEALEAIVRAVEVRAPR